jgi:hypothetical protein
LWIDWIQFVHAISVAQRFRRISRPLEKGHKRNQGISIVWMPGDGLEHVFCCGAPAAVVQCHSVYVGIPGICRIQMCGGAQHMDSLRSLPLAYH